LQVRVVMLVDLDYFYAQCEERRNPSIKDKPVVVCVYSGRSEDSGAVATANYVARKYGVKSGIPISLAKKRLKEVPDAVFIPVDREFYEEVSGRVMNILRGYADGFEQVGIDEAYLEVTTRVKNKFDYATELATTIKNDVKKQEGITCSIGVGPNKLIAKIASDIKKPDGLTVVEPGQIESFLSPMSVDRILGIGSKTMKKMDAMGIKTIKDLSSYDLQRLIEVFGKSLGIYFHNASLGIDETPVQEREEVESISRIATLKENTLSLDVILERANQLCDDVGERLAERGLTFRSVGIVAILTDLTVHSKSRTLDIPSSNVNTIKSTVKELFEKFVAESEKEVRRVGVRVSNLGKQKKAQEQLTDFIEPLKSS
jgi:DNA polymerase IV (DinB-like DNA polymerase)